MYRLYTGERKFRLQCTPPTRTIRTRLARSKAAVYEGVACTSLPYYTESKAQENHYFKLRDGSCFPGFPLPFSILKLSLLYVLPYFTLLI